MRELSLLIKHVGRGARLAKALPYAEARAAMEYIVSGAADPVQIGGFLIAMRMKSETAEELAGFTEALRGASHLDLPSATVDVDLHGDGRAGRPSVGIAAACIAATFGVRTLLRGWFRSPYARSDLGAACARLGIDPACGLAAARRGLETGVGLVDLEDYAPRVAGLLALREQLGVRTCVNSAVKLLDPTGTRRLLVGIFHSPYHEPIAGAAHRLGVLRAAIVQAPGGVPELAPDKPTRVTLVDEIGIGATTPLVGGGAAPEPVGNADEVADSTRAILHGNGPPGQTRMAVLTAALLRWAAGHAATPQDNNLISGCYTAIEHGTAEQVLTDLSLCYRT